MNRKTFLSSVAGLFGLSMVKPKEDVKVLKYIEGEKFLVYNGAVDCDGNYIPVDFRQLTRTIVSESDYVVFPKAET